MVNDRYSDVYVPRLGWANAAGIPHACGVVAEMLEDDQLDAYLVDAFGTPELRLAVEETWADRVKLAHDQAVAEGSGIETHSIAAHKVMPRGSLVRVGTLTEEGVEIDHGDGVPLEMALGDPELARRAPNAEGIVARWLRGHRRGRPRRVHADGIRGLPNPPAKPRRSLVRQPGVIREECASRRRSTW